MDKLNPVGSQALHTSVSEDSPKPPEQKPKTVPDTFGFRLGVDDESKAAIGLHISEPNVGRRCSTGTTKLGELKRANGDELFKTLDEAIAWMQLAPISQLGSERTRRFTEDLPKVDLHRHLEGAIEPEVLWDVAAKHGIKLPAESLEELRPLVQVTAKDKTLLDFIAKFGPIGEVFTAPAVIESLTIGVVEDAARDNVEHLELRFSPLYMAQAHNLDLDEIIKAVVRGVKSGSENNSTSVRLILIVERQLGVEYAEIVEALAEKYKDRGVVAIDLANDEFNYPPGPYAQVFQRAKKAGLAVPVHAGEAAGPENVATSINDLGADRIGHGVRTYQDLAVEDLVRRSKVPLELCPTSNVQTGAIGRLADHPLPDYLARGLRVTINTDDPAISGITLSGEFETAANQFDLSVAQIKLLVENSLAAAFLSQPEREIVERRVAGKLAAVEQKLLESISVEELRSMANHAIRAQGFDSDTEGVLLDRIGKQIDRVAGGATGDETKVSLGQPRMAP